LSPGCGTGLLVLSCEGPVKKGKILVLIVGLGLLGLAVAVLAIHSAPAKRYLLGTVSQILRESQGIGLEVAELDYNLLRLTLSAQGVTARLAEAEDAPPFLRAGSLQVRLDPRGVFRGRLVVADAEIRGLSLAVWRDGTGELNLPLGGDEAEDTGDPGWRPAVLIRRLSVPNASLQVKDQPADLELSVPNWSLDVHGEPSLRHSVRLRSFGEGTFRRDQVSLPIRDLAAEFGLSPADVKVESLGLEVGSSRLDAKGKIGDWISAEPWLDVEIIVRVLLEEAALVSGLGENYSGVARIGATARGPLDRAEVRLAVGGEDLHLPHLGPSSLEIQGRWTMPEDVAHLNSFALRSGLGEIHARGRFAMDAEGETRTEVSLRRLDLTRISRLFPDYPEFAGQVDATLDLSFPGLRADRLRGRIDLRFDPGRATGEPAGVTVAGALRAEASPERVVLVLDRIRLLDLEIDGRTEVDLQEGLGHPGTGLLTGELRVEAPSLENTVRGLDSAFGLLGSETLQDWRPDGTAEVLLRLGGTLDNPTVRGNLSASRVRFRDLSGITVAAEAVYRADSLRLNDFRCEWEGRALSGRGGVLFAGPDSVLELTARLDPFPIAAVEGLLGSELPLRGVLESEVAVEGTLAEPRARLVLRGREIEAYGESLGRLDLTGRLSGSRVEIVSGEWIKPGPGDRVGRLSLEGAYDLETGTYEFGAKGSQLAFQNASLPGDVAASGILDIETSGAGTGMDATLDLGATIRDLRIQGYALGRVAVAADLRDGLVSSRVDLAERGLSFRSQGRISHPYPLDLEIELDRTDLALLPLELPEELSLAGLVTGRVWARADLDDWRGAEAEAEVRLHDAALGGREIRAAEPVRVSFREGELDLETGRIELGASNLRLTGRLPLEGNGEARVRAAVDVAELLSLVPDVEAYGAAGNIELDGLIRGSLVRIDPEIRLSLRSGRMEIPGFAEAASELAFDARIVDGNLGIANVSGYVGGGRLEAQADIPLGLFPFDLPVELPLREGPGRGRFSLRGMDLAALEAFPEAAEGRFSATAEFEADSLDVEGLRAEMRIEEFWARIEGREFRQDSPGRIFLEEGLVTFDRLGLSGPQMNVWVVGTTDLGPSGEWNLQVGGDLDLAAPTALMDGLQAVGPARLRLDLTGPLGEPKFNGSLEIEGGEAAVSFPSLRVQDLNLRLGFTRDRLEIEQLTGTLNGGRVRGSGGMNYSAAGPDQVEIDLEADEILFDFPEGLKTLSRGTLRLRTREEDIVLGGSLEILEGFHRDPVNLEGELFRTLRAGRSIETEEGERSPLLARLRFDLGLETVNPIVVENNLARMLLNARVRLVGGYYRPALIGRIDLEEGGELYLRERTFLVERGRVSFFDGTRLRPVLDVLARTQVRGYDIALQFSGDPENLTSTLSSDPPLSEPDIVALLVTGRRLEELRGAEAEVAREQALSYLAGTVGGRLEREAEAALGLSQVRIEPQLISPESSPGARLTVGQDITSRLTLIYSMNLVDSGDQIYIADFAVTPRFSTRGVKQEDNTYRFEFGHELRFGGGVDRTPRDGIAAHRSTVGEVVFEGASPFTDRELERRLGVREGDAFNFFSVHKGMERLRTLFNREDFLEARLRLERREAGSRTDLRIAVEAGPRIVFRFEGEPLPGSAREKVRHAWTQGLSETHRIEASLSEMRTHLRNRGYLEAEIDWRVAEPSEGVKEIVFSVQRGVLYRDRELVLEGMSRITPDRLRVALERAGLMEAYYFDPQPAADFIGAFYRREGYLAARIGVPRIDLDPSRGIVRVVIEIEEGPAFSLGRVEIAGNRVLATESLLDTLALDPGQRYQPQVRADAVERIEDRYLSKGFNAVRIAETVRRDVDAGTVDVLFEVEEGPVQEVGEISVEGNVRTSSAFVKRHLPLSPGDPLDLEKIGRARKRLYESGAFALVEIEAEGRESSASAVGVQPTRIEIRVREQPPYILRYGGFYDTDRGPGAITDLTTRNLIGSGRILGVRGRYDGDFRELRVYSSQPYFLNLPVASSLTALLRREIRGAFVTDRKGVSLEQEAQLGNSLLVSYGYRFDRTHTVGEALDVGIDTPAINVASLTATLGRDARDDILDATRGSFFSHAAQFAPEFLGSDVRFGKYFGQFFHYRPLSEPAEVPFGGGLKRSRLVFGTGVRLGFAAGLGGQTLPLGERFFAGGGTTIRGFGQNEVGPQDASGNPVGGEALFILNNELRFPMVSILDGVAFLDAGNVFPRVSNFDPLDLRTSAGVGLRIRTPYVLLRLDYGFKLRMEPGESRGALFFSIGQAF
jgi:outer membrane protein assembly complex protein YaeT